MSAESGLYTLIEAVAPVFALRAPANQDAPFIIYQRVDGVRWRDINGPSGVAQATMQIDVYDLEYFDAKAKAKIIMRVDKMELGLFGDVEPIGAGLSELRIHYGPGYRVYYTGQQ